MAQNLLPHIYVLVALVVGLAIGFSGFTRYETTKLTESADSIRFFPVAITDRITGQVRFCYVEPILDQGYSRYACH